MQQNCPKCKAPKVKETEFCSCGHKWVTEAEQLKDLFGGLNGAGDIFGDIFGGMFGKK